MEPVYLIGKTIYEIWPLEISKLIESYCKAAFKGKKQQIEFEFKNRNWLTYIVLSSRNDQFVNMIIIDITDRKQIEEIQKKNLIQEKELSQLKSQIINVISHEMRTPLTSIVMAISILKDANDNFLLTKKNKYFKTIEDSVKDLEEITENVIIINKAEANALKPQMEKMNLLEFCHYIIEQIQNINPDYSIEFENSLKGDEFYLLDFKLLKKVLQNLLSNAIKYSPINKKINFRVHQIEEWIEFQIQDWGIGIPKEDQNKLYESFFRAKNAKNFQGQGLGLHIAKHAINTLNGNLSFVSEENKGTTFTIKIKIEL